MAERAHLRVQYLRQLTDRIGLSIGGNDGGWGGMASYSTLDNAEALRLAVRLAAMGLHDDAQDWASTYLRFLFQAMRSETTMSGRRNALGSWSDEPLSRGDLARAGRALAMASASQITGVLAQRAEAMWHRLLPDLSKTRCARTVACWLIAMAERPPAEQRKIEPIAEQLASWMVEHCYYPIRSSEWEWFDNCVRHDDYSLPHGMWAAYAILGESRYARVAEATTTFLIQHLFEDGLFLPIGDDGQWPRHHSKALFAQRAQDVAAMVELLAYAYELTGEAPYGEYATYAQSWFTGNNLKGIAMLDDTTGGTYDALTREGHSPRQSASAIVSYLLGASALRTVQASRVVDMGTVVRV